MSIRNGFLSCNPNLQKTFMRSFRIVLLIGLLNVLLQVLDSQTYATENIRTVALENGPFPGSNSGGVFRGFFSTFGFRSLSLNNKGHVAFSASIFDNDRPGGRNSESAIFTGNSVGDLELITREGIEIPGQSGVAHGYGNDVFENIQLNDEGDLTFFSTLSGDGINPNGVYGLFRSQVDGVKTIARSQMPIPSDSGHAGSFLLGSDYLRLKQSQGDHTSFISFLRGSNTLGLWTADADNELTLVAISGDQVPGLEQGVFYGGYEFHYQALAGNARGTSAFHSRLDGAGIDQTNNEIILARSSSNEFRVVARSGNTAPGMPQNVVFEGSEVFDVGTNLVRSILSMNNNDQVIFASTVVGEGINQGNNDGLWSEGRGNGLELIAREGDQIPNAESGVFYGQASWPTINDSGHAAFEYSLVGPSVNDDNDEAIFVDQGGTVPIMLARTGERSPIAGIQASFSSLGIPQINDLGQVAFSSFVEIDGELSCFS